MERTFFLSFVRTALHRLLLATFLLISLTALQTTLGGGHGGTGVAGMAWACDPNAVGSNPCMDLGVIDDPSTAEGAWGQRALFLVDYSLGIGNNNNCFTCTFVQQFMLAIASFSAAVFMYFRAFFVTLAPIFLAIWIGWSTGRLMLAGGDGGRDFFYAMVRKFALFVVLWLVLMQGGPQGSAARDTTVAMPVTNAEAPWTWFGPILLTFGFELGNEVRTQAAQSLSVGGQSVANQLGMNCRGVGNLNPTLSANPDAFEFAFHASEMACAIERIHIVGIAAGLAMVEGAFTTLSLLSLDVIYNLFSALIVSVFGLFVIVVFALSAIWFTFLLLDVVVKILIIAAIAPIMLLLALLVPTRRYALNALRQSLGGVATLLGVAFIAALAFFLIANTPTVYNTARVLFDPTLMELPSINTVVDLREFVRRVMIDDSDPRNIPMDISTPWFHYMVLTSLSIFALGKKVIAIIESIVGVQGMSTMADSAKKIAIMGAAAGGVAAFMGGKAGWWGLKQGGKVGLAGGGAAWEAFRASAGAAGTIGAGLGGMKAAIINPFAKNAEGTRPIFGLGKTVADTLKTAKDANTGIQEGLENTSGDPNAPRR